jgi:hypothetical protein
MTTPILLTKRRPDLCIGDCFVVIKDDLDLDLSPLIGERLAFVKRQYFEAEIVDWSLDVLICKIVAVDVVSGVECYGL